MPKNANPANTFFDAQSGFANTFFDAKESIQRKAPLSRSKARWKIAALRRKRNSLAAIVSKLKQPFS